MAAKRYMDLIEELFNYIEGCEKKVFSSDKVIVEKDVVFTLLDELRSATPDEIKRCQKIIGSREAIFKQADGDKEGIINEARKAAAQIEEEARLNAQRLVEENEITRRAYETANSVVQDAQVKADKVRADAKSYAESMKNGALNYVETIMNDMNQQLSRAYIDAKDNSEKLIKSLKEHLVEIEHNHEELRDVMDSYTGEPDYLDNELSDDSEEPEAAEEEMMLEDDMGQEINDLENINIELNEEDFEVDSTENN